MAFVFGPILDRVLMMKRIPILQIAIQCMALLLCVPIGAFSQSQTPGSVMEMKPFQEPTYKPAVALGDSKVVLKALEQASRHQLLVKLPVIVTLRENGRPSWDQVVIGTDPAADDPLVISLDDSALGVSLADRLHQSCTDNGPCRLWLVGYWHDKMVQYDECSPSLKRRMLQLSIRHVVGPQADSDLAQIYIAKH